MVLGDGGSRPPVVDVTDETLVVAPVTSVRDLLCDEARWETVLPGVRLSCIEDRGPLGKRWSASGSLEGSAEVWLEPWADGVIVHVFLQADPREFPGGARGGRRLQRRYALRVKEHVVRTKDTLEAGRAPGTRRVGSVRGNTH